MQLINDLIKITTKNADIRSSKTESNKPGKKGEKFFSTLPADFKSIILQQREQVRLEPGTCASNQLKN